MTIFKNKTENEIDVLAEIQAKLEKQEKREHILKVIVASLAVFSIASFFAGHFSPRQKVDFLIFLIRECGCICCQKRRKHPHLS